MNRVLIGQHSFKTQENRHRLQIRTDISRGRKSASVVRNPIKVVMDLIGEDGNFHQKIVNQPPIDPTFRMPSYKTARQAFSHIKSSPRLQKQEMTPTFSKTMQSTQPNGLARSFVFNRFSYDNCRQFPIPKTRNSMPAKQSKGRPNSSHKNLQIVYCQNRLGQFVEKTNEHIEELYKKQQQKEHSTRKTLLQRSNSKSITNSGISSSRVLTRRPTRTSLATCLKEYATLEKISLFMESENRRDKCLCYEMERDPSRTLMLDIITHRFNFLKSMNKKVRDHLYSSLLGRQVNSLSKINIQEYMKISAMFVGRDASCQEMGAFAYSFLFGDREPSFEMVRDRLEMLKGHSYKLKGLLEELFVLTVETKGPQELMDGLSKNESLLHMLIGYIVERD